MEHLQTQDKKQRRTVYSEGGNEVLRLSYPTVTGDTPAANHTAALVKALVDYGEKRRRGSPPRRCSRHCKAAGFLILPATRTTFR